MKSASTPYTGTLSTTVRAFDRLAPRYDELCGGTLFRRMRDRVHQTLGRAFGPGSRVLEIGCGSGLDTSFLAARGARVVASDPSAGMIDRARRRLGASPGPGAVQFICCGVDEIEAHLGPTAVFDGLFSDFGALNCVPRLDPLARLAARRLASGGRVIVCLLSRTCLVEMAWFLLRGDRRRALRRLGRPPVTVTVEGLDVATYYHRVRDVREALGPRFVVRRVTGLSVLVPPPYLEARWSTLPPRARRLLEAVDVRLSAVTPFNRLGDHVMLECERVATEDVRFDD